jgi:undecaprenyl-diphosphatase
VGTFGAIAATAKKKSVAITCVVLALMVGFSRMYIGVHTPADVLVSLGIAAALVLLGHPLFEKARQSPKVMYGILLAFPVLMGLYLCFVYFFPFSENVDPHNLLSAQKNGYTLLGCALGLVLTYTVDLKWTRFETKAVWWAQLIKAVGGILLVLAAKELLRAPLDALFGGHLAARSVRYFLMVVVGGILWPMTFRFFKSRKE